MISAINILKKIHGFLEDILWGFCKILPIKKNQIVMSSYYGRGYSDNLKYITEALKNSNVTIVWMVKNKNEASTLPGGIRACKINSLKRVYYLATSGIWVDNCRKWFKYKKNNQVYIQTWHGNATQKKIEKDAEDKLDPGYVRMAKKDGANTDYMISESKLMTDLYHNAFWTNAIVLELGYPRYDLLLKHDKTLEKEKIHKYYNIRLDKKIVLYAPTFRSDYNFDAYDLDYNRVLDALSSRFTGEFVFLIHLHPNVANYFEQLKYDGKRIINATSYPDMQELMAASDVLIGDYSSVNYEFSLMKKPVFRFAVDVDDYKKQRGLYFSVEDYPFPLAANNDELLNAIMQFDEKIYIYKLDEFMSNIRPVITDNASQRCAQFIVDLINNDLKKDLAIIDYKQYIR